MKSLVAVGLAFVWMGMIACGGNSEGGDEDDDDSGGSNGALGGGSSGGASGTASRGGSSGTGAGGTSGAETGGFAGLPNDWATVCERAVAVMCPKYEACAPFVTEVALTPDCPTYVRKGCNDAARLSDVRMTPADYAACIEAFARESCDDWVYNGILPPECATVPGSRPTGSPCGSSLQCASGVCSTSNLACSICTESPPGEGESCFEVGCLTGLVCNEASICVLGRHLGESCSDATPCVGTLLCQSGTCARPPGEGAPCADAGLGCDLLQGIVCNELTGLCEKLPLPAVGEACSGYCQAGATCMTASNGSAVCTTSRRAGEPCASQDVCDQWLTCSDGACQEFDPATCN